MPPVVLYVAGVIVSAFGVTTAVGVAIAYIAASVIVYGSILYAAYAYNSAIQMAKRAMGNMTSAVDTGRSIMARDPVAPWRYIYGQIQVSGPIIYMKTSGTDNEYLHVIVVLARHECEELGDVKFGEDIVPIDGSNNATGKYAGYARIKKYKGIAAGERDTELETESGGQWLPSCLGKNVARLHLRFKYNNDLFVNGLPIVTCLTKGKKVLDFRATYPVIPTVRAYSNNAELCCLDFLMDPYLGKAVPIAKVNAAVAVSDANTCDESVGLNPSGTEPRYTLNGAVQGNQEPDQALQEMLSAMAGNITDAGGQWTIRCGAWRASSLALGDGDLAGSFSYVPRQSRQDTFNGVKGTFISPINKWNPTDFPAVKNDTYMGWDGGTRLWKDVVYNFVTSASQVQRLAKIDLECARQQGVFSADFMLKAMQCQPNDIISMTRARMGWGSKTFEVQKWGFKVVEGDGGGQLVVSVTGKELAAACFDWANGEETRVDLTPDSIVVNGDVVASPAIPTLSTANVTQPDGTIVPRLRVQWSALADIRVVVGGVTQIEYKKSADANWLEWATARGGVLDDYILDVTGGVSYDVRIRFRNDRGIYSAYSAVATATVTLDVSAPGAPTNLVATSAAGAVILDWDDNAESDLDEYELWRNTVNTFPGGVMIWKGYASQHVDFFGGIGVTQWYALKAVDTSVNKSGFSNHVSAAASASGGAPGSDAVASILTNDAATVPADNAGTVSNWANAVSQMKVFLGINDNSASWTFSKVDTNCTSALTGSPANICTVSAMSADNAYVDVTATRSGYATQTKRFTLTKSKTGGAGSNGINAKLVVLTSDVQTVGYAKAAPTTPVPSVVNFVATGQNLAGSPTFTITAGAVTGGLTGSGTTRAFSPSNWTTDNLTVQVTWDGQTDYISLVKVREGIDGTVGADSVASILTNDAATVPADNAGSVSSWANAVSQMKVFLGITDNTASWVVTPVGTNCTFTGANPVTLTSITSGDSAYVTFTATRSGFATQTKVFTVSKSKTGNAGGNGINAKLVVLTSDVQTVGYAKAAPTTPVPSVVNFTATGQNLSGSPTFTITAGAVTGGLTGSGTTRAFSASNWTTDNLTVMVTWDGQTDYISLVKVREGIDGSNGTNGGYTDYVFTRATSAPAIPTGSTPAGWYDSPPAATGDPLNVLYMSVGDKNSAGTLIGSWATPVQVEGASLVIEYSVNGSSGWHSTFAGGDLFARQKVAGGAFSAAYRIVGETGGAGSNGTNGKDGGNCTLICDASMADLGGGNIQRISGSGWDSQAYSKEKFSGAVYCSFLFKDIASYSMGGLNTDLTADSAYGTIDFAWHKASGGFVYCFENGSNNAGPFGWAAGDVMSIVWNGTSVIYYQNGYAIYTSANTPSGPLGFDSSIVSSGDQILSIRLGPSGKNGNNGTNGTNGTNGSNGSTVLGSVGGGGSITSNTYATLSPSLALTLSCDGSTRMLALQSGFLANASGSTQSLYAALFMDGTMVAEWNAGSGYNCPSGFQLPLEISCPVTPSAGTHTFSLRVHGTGSNGVAAGGTLVLF